MRTERAILSPFTYKKSQENHLYTSCVPEVSLFPYQFFFFFLISRFWPQGEEGEIRTIDLSFMRCSPADYVIPGGNFLLLKIS